MGGAVSWSSKLQSRVARSTTEAQFIAGESGTRDTAFFRYILEDLGYKMAIPQALGMDNQSAIRVAKNPEHQGRMKHLNPIYYGFREQVEKCHHLSFPLKICPQILRERAPSYVLDLAPCARACNASSSVGNVYIMYESMRECPHSTSRV